MTYHVTAEYAKTHFDEVLERASLDVEGVVIVMNNKSYVLIDQEEIEALIETTELLKDSELLTDIAATKKDYRQGETLSMEQIFG
jgi:antitoxin YefM